MDEFTRATRASIEDLVQFGMDTFELVAENSIYIWGLQIEHQRILRELRVGIGERDRGRVKE